MHGRYVIFFYTSEPKPPEVITDLAALLERVVEITKTKAKFTVYEVGECVGDFS